jgi:hypothetical protein
MNLKLSQIVFLLIFAVFSCKQDTPFSDYKYADKPTAFNCEGTNTKLLNEALYSFENDIVNHYKIGSQNFRLDQAYSQIISNTIYGRLKLEEVVSKHSVEIFNALKKENGLWDVKNAKSKLNYNSAVVSCISNNIKDKALKTTLNALISTHSMTPKLFGSPLTRKYRFALNDKNLAMYIALDFYYAKMFDIDFSKVNLNKPEQKVDFNKAPSTGMTNTHNNH